MPIKRDMTLELSKEELMEISENINQTLKMLAGYANNLAKMYYVDDPNMVLLIFDRLLLNYILNMSARVHKLEQEWAFEFIDQIDKAKMEMENNGAKKT